MRRDKIALLCWNDAGITMDDTTTKELRQNLEAADAPTLTPPDAAHSKLSAPRSQLVLEALAELDRKAPSPGPNLADVYLGALIARAQTNNPEALVQAAHSLRELMEKMPRIQGIPVRAKELSGESKKLIVAWDRIRNAISDDRKRKRTESFHVLMVGFADSFRDPGQGRKRQAGELFSQLDQRRHRLPPAIESHRIAEWSDYEKYFQNVAHHRHSTTPTEFETYLAGLEEFLLNYLRPRTYDDRATIQSIIEGKKGESHA